MIKHKVLIVEDEILVRMGLKNSIQWSKFNMIVAAEASNGQEAWDIFLKEKPDVVITDLRMPILDGMALISKIREIDKTCKIIILTCVEDFENSHKAIKYSVTDYILKLSMTWDEIDAVLRKTKVELEKTNREVSLYEASEDNKEELKQCLIKSFIDIDASEQDNLSNQVSVLEWKVKPYNLVVGIMHIDTDRNSTQSTSKEHKQIKSLAITNMLTENFERIPGSEVIYESDYRYVIIFNADSLHTDIACDNQWQHGIKPILDHTESVMMMYLNASVVFGFSSLGTGFSSLKKLYHEASAALQESYFFNRENKMFYADGFNSSSPEDICNRIIDAMKNNERINELFASGMDEIERKVSCFLNECTIDSENIRMLFYKLINWPAEIFKLTNEMLEVSMYSCMNEIFKCDVMEDMIEAYIRYLIELADIKSEKMIYSREVSGIVNYINTNYMKDISLGEAAQKVNKSPGYISGLFKKEMDMSFTEYLIWVRINKAKELLASTYLKLYQISENVGFTDYSYFSRAFKKQTGTRPQYYRDQWGTLQIGDENG
ncbi:response regulator transcription factor [Paenibacillus sp. FSL H7-0714]|uniref:response regulator transcription factor n=1 Tax=Paenibacillus sp. FSL H7-0714 TaxID=2954735 RepID=UPI0030FBB69C